MGDPEPGPLLNIQRGQVAMELSRPRIALLAVIVAAPFLFLLWSQAVGPRYSGLKPGDRVPVADLVSLSGETVSTGSWRGRATLLVLFQPGCKACREEIADLADLAPVLTGVRIALLSVKTGAQSSNESFPTYVDPSGVFLAKMRKLIVPTVYWIGPDGRVRYARVGRAGKNDQAVAYVRMLSHP